MKLVLNGRFLGRPITGVDRLATELARAIAREIADGNAPDTDLEVAVPATIAIDPAQLEDGSASSRLPYQVIGSRGGHAWEQTTLARYRPEAWLLNLCNTAPMWRRRQAVMICDAQFVERPESYSWAFRTWYRVLLSTVGRRAALVYTISESSRLALEKYGIVPPGKARVLRLGIDHLDRFAADDGILSRFEASPGGYILAIGSLARHKNLPMLVEAFLAANLPGVRLVIAGGGNPAIFRDAGLPTAPNVDYLGRVSDAELKSLYGHAMAFCCPSITEGFGLPPLEAMRVGCPVIATTGGAVPETCGDAALYADPLDRNAWTQALQRVVGDPDLRMSMAAKARARAAEFTWAGAARHLLDDLAHQKG